MKTSLDNLQWMEDCLLGRASGADQALFEARVLVDPVLREDVQWQRRTYAIIQEYGRRQFRNELDQLYNTLFSAPEHRSFKEKVLSFFRS